MILAQRRFTLADQRNFAAFSGDHNPMHLDALWARRTQAGAPVVHGIHLLLWALEAFAANAAPPPLRRLKAEFGKFVYLDEDAEIVLTQSDAKRARLALNAGGILRMNATLEFGVAPDTRLDWDAASLEPMPQPSRAVDLAWDDMPGQAGKLAFVATPAEAHARFPKTAAWLGAHRVAGLAASTQLVGMVCPGLHSIFGNLTLAACETPLLESALAFRMAEADPRFRMVKQDILGGGWSGAITSFARMPPVRQPGMAALRAHVDPVEFAGAVVLIVGGSRGLGELAAKLVAAGGGEVIVTWQSGKDDAARVAGEIRDAGGSCEIMAYDARKPAAEQLAALGRVPTHLYYFATRTIFRHQAEIFDAQRLRDFLAVYVDGFWDIARTLAARHPALSVLYPSTIFVDEAPKGMTEYAMAKAAGERLCSDMNKFMAPLHVTAARLPRLLTDQTAGITPSEIADPLAVLLPLVRHVQSGRREAFRAPG